MNPRTSIDIAFGNLVTVTAGADAGNTNFGLVLAGVITGTIRDSLAQPIAGIDLDIFDVSSGVRLRRGATSAVDGTYQFDRLQPGTYIVRADPTPAQSYATQYYNGKTTQSTADVIAVTSALTTSSIDFALSSAGTISGTVTHATLGIPLPGLDLDIYDANTLIKLVQTAITDSLGNYSLTNLPPGQYFVAIDPIAGQPFFAEYYNGAPTSATATSINVPIGASVTGIDFQVDFDPAQLPAGGNTAKILLAVCLFAGGIAALRRSRASKGA